MNTEKINKIPHKASILLAPLDWGLGHATRCIPIINELLNNNCEIHIAASGPSAALLKKEFPQLPVLFIKGYNIHYTRRKFWLLFSVIWQLPKLLFKIIYENKWLKKWLTQNKIDIVISDNRLGFYNKNVKNIYITHQLKIKTGNNFTEWIAQKIHYYFINKYDECWVPDVQEKNNITGELSHPKALPKTPVKYIGILSRFEKQETPLQYDFLFIISGPEPQRSMFEQLIFKELENYNGSALIVRGLPADSKIKKINNNKIEIKNHLSTQELNLVINQSKYFISRSGYTTVMDLIKLQKNATLIPTPGQTEQEYLAKYLKEKKFFYTLNQKRFSLQEIIDIADKNKFSIPEFSMEEYKRFISELLKTHQ